MRYLAIITLIIATYSIGSAQGIDFFHGSWEEALTEAKEQQKIIFVDAFTTWCGPCKRMAREVFPDEKVGDFYNRYFISVKLDMEKGEGLKFRKEYPVSAFPTLFYINGDGEVVQKVKGAQGTAKFIETGKKALALSDNSEEYAARYEEGERNPDFILKYIKSLNNSGQSSLKVANEFLNSQTDLSTPGNLQIILEAATEADSRIFGLLERHMDKIKTITGEEDLRFRIEQACKATAAKANEFNSLEILEEAQEKMRKYCPDVAEEFEYKSTLDFHVAQRNPAEYAKACKKYAKKAIKAQAEKLNELANTMYINFKDEPIVLEQAEIIAGNASKQGMKHDYYVTYARILKDNGKNQEAIEAAEKALELGRESGPYTVKMLESFLQKMKA